VCLLVKHFQVEEQNSLSSLERKNMIDREIKQKDRKKAMEVNKTNFVTISAKLLANLVQGCAPPQQYFPKDTVLALGMTLLELQYILH